MEYSLPVPPGDPVSALAFNPNPARGTQLLAASWDKTVRLYHLPSPDSASPSSAAEAAAQVKLVHTFTHDAAVLDVCWISDTLAASGGLDRRVRLLNLETGQMNIIGKHAMAVSRLRYSAATRLLISASWDATLKVWNPHAAEAAALYKTLTLPEKILALDVSPPFPPSDIASEQQGAGAQIQESTSRLVVGMTGRLVYIYDLGKWRGALEAQGNGAEIAAEGATQTEGDGDNEAWKPEQKRESSLKFMLRDVRCMPTGIGYATSSVDGRIAVEFFDPSESAQSQKYAFKCHRQVVDGVDTVYPVNAMAFHPVHATFASLGGDAVLSIWDPLAKKRIRQYPRLPSPLSTGAISSDGQLLAAASGFENIEETRHTGAAPGEVGGIGAGGEGKVQIHVRTAWEDCKPKAKGAA